VTRLHSTIAGALVLLCLTACSINPVTGEREVTLISAGDEIAIGSAQYSPSRQMQGGDYVLDPDLTAYVAGVGERLAAVSDRDLPYEFSILNSSIPNAWALPGGKIAVNRGLLTELDSEAELAAVLGHEIVHAAARHGAQAMQRGLLLQTAVLVTGIAAQRGNYSNLVVGAASLGAQLINQRNGRGAELESDEYGMLYMSRAGYDPSAAVSLQETFVRLSSGRPQAGWLEGLFASHPPSGERVERNRETAARLPSGGEIGRDEYQRATANLRRTRPAYDAYDRGRMALSEGRVDDARGLADEALRQYPAEANFHALKGDIALSERDFREAADYFRAAIARNDAFFYYPLRLGQSLRALNEVTAAESQLEASLALLPTADAHFALGQISESRGDRQAALEHYRAAAGSSSTTGQSAQEAAVRLDLPSNPGAYLSLRTAINAQGRLLVEIANPTPVAVADIGLSIRYVATSGQIVTAERTVTSTIAAKASQLVDTGIGPLAADTAHEVVVSRARVIE